VQLRLPYPARPVERLSHESGQHRALAAALEKRGALRGRVGWRASRARGQTSLLQVLDRKARPDGPVLLQDIARGGEFVLVLDQEPGVLGVTGLDQGEGTLELVAAQREGELA